MGGWKKGGGGQKIYFVVEAREIYKKGILEAVLDGGGADEQSEPKDESHFLLVNFRALREEKVYEGLTCVGGQGEEIDSVENGSKKYTEKGEAGKKKRGRIREEKK